MISFYEMIKKTIKTRWGIIVLISVLLLIIALNFKAGYLVLGNEILDAKSSEEVKSIQADLKYINACAVEGPSTMQCIKNKKTGAVVVCPGNLSRIKEMFNDDWAIVESEIKE